MEAIDKGKVIAEIKELYNDIDKCISELIAARGKHDGNGISNAHWRMETLMVNTQQAICNVIDTFETKEVDLDSNIRTYLTNHFNIYEDGVLQSKKSGLPLRTYDIIKVAKHFFELDINSK